MSPIGSDLPDQEKIDRCEELSKTMTDDLFRSSLEQSKNHRGPERVAVALRFVFRRSAILYGLPIPEYLSFSNVV